MRAKDSTVPKENIALNHIKGWSNVTLISEQAKYIAVKATCEHSGI